MKICHQRDDLLQAFWKFTKTPKDNEKRRNQARFNVKINSARDNSKNNNHQNIYASIARMSSIDECSSGNFGGSSKLAIRFWIMEQRAT